MLLLYYQFRLFTARIEIPCIIKRGKEVILWKYKFLTTLIRKKSYGADNVSVPPHSPTVPSISSQGKTCCLCPRLERIPRKRTAPLTHGSGCGLLILIYLFLTSRSDAPFPQKIIFSGLRPDMEKVSVSCGRILLKCSSPLLSPKGNPFPLYGVP